MAMRYDGRKATPLVRLKDHPINPNQTELNSFIADGKVYEAWSNPEPNTCYGCKLERGDKYCLQVSCSAWMRGDDDDVIFVEVQNYE